jgi:hypothetical protein
MLSPDTSIKLKATNFTCSHVWKSRWFEELKLAQGASYRVSTMKRPDFGEFLKIGKCFFFRS